MKRIIGVLLSSIVAMAIFAFTAFNVMPALTGSMVHDGATPASFEVPGDQRDSSPEPNLLSSVNDLFFAEEPSASVAPQYREPTTKQNKPEEVSSRRFYQLNRQGLVLVKFGADWCGPCRRMSPELEKFAANNTSIKVLEVDIDKEERLAEKFKVGSIPHIVLFQDGKQIKNWTGFKSASTLQKSVNSVKPAAPAGVVQANPFASE